MSTPDQTDTKVYISNKYIIHFLWIFFIIIIHEYLNLHSGIGVRINLGYVLDNQYDNSFVAVRLRYGLLDPLRSTLKGGVYY